MFWVYIIFSQNLNQFYIGESNDLDLRIRMHNNHTFSKANTVKANDWKYCWCLPCNSRTQARRIESFIKQMKSRKFIERLILADATWLYSKLPK